MAQPSPEFDERNFTSRDGLKLYYRDYPGPTPSGVTALCLHGLTRNSKDFEELAPRLARSRRVLCLDVRGRGRSERDPQPERYLPTTYAQDVLELLEAAGVARVAVIGTSMGGILALLLAALRPAGDRRRGAERHRAGRRSGRASRASPATSARAPRSRAGTRPPKR